MKEIKYCGSFDYYEYYEEVLDVLVEEPTGKIGFFARDEEVLYNEAWEFAKKVEEKTKSHLIVIDMADELVKGNTPYSAVKNALCQKVQQLGLLFNPNVIGNEIDALCKCLTPQTTGRIATTPVLFIKHFQCCTKMMKDQDLAKFIFFRSIPCRLIVTSNMTLGEIERMFNMGDHSLLAPLVEDVMIVGDKPFLESEYELACQQALKTLP